MVTIKIVLCRIVVYKLILSLFTYILLILKFYLIVFVAAISTIFSKF